MPHRCLARDSVRPRPRLAARSPIPRRAFGLACVAPVRRPLAARLPSLPTASPGGPPSRPTKTGRSRDVDSRMPELIRNSGGPAAAAQSSRGAATKCACQHRPRSHPGNVCESALGRAATGHRRLTQPGRAGLMPLWSVGGSAHAAADVGRRGRLGRRRRGGKTAQDGFQPTAIADPGSAEAVQAATDNALGRITLDDGRSTQNPATVSSAAGLVYLSRSPRGRRSSARPHLCAGDGTRCGMGERVIRKLTGVSIR
jgi:hypothetical protein